MSDDYVLIKKQGSVMINTWWIRETHKEIDLLANMYEALEDIDLIKHWSTQYYHASSLYERERTRADLTTKILQQQSPKNLFFYDSHFYYLYGNETLGTQAYDSYLTDLGYIFYVIWNETFLDNHGITLMKDKKAYYLIDPSSSFMKSWYSLRILWDYVIEATLPTDITAFYEKIFETTTALESFDVEIFRGVFKLKSNCSLRVTHDKHIASSLKQQLLKSFPAGMRRDI